MENKIQEELKKTEDRTQENIKMLDKINFDEFFREASENVLDLMNRVEDRYDHTKFSDNDVMQGYVFNWIGQDDFCEYLKNRYPERFHSYEITETYYYID